MREDFQASVIQSPPRVVYSLNFSSFLFVCLFSFLRQSLALLPRLECSGVISVHYNLCLLDSSNSSASAFPVAEIASTHHHTQLMFVFLVEMRFYHVGQDGLKLLTSGDPPASASQSATIAGLMDFSFAFYTFPTNI